MKKVTSVSLPVAALVVALSAGDARAQSNPWSVSFDGDTSVVPSLGAGGGLQINFSDRFAVQGDVEFRWQGDANDLDGLVGTGLESINDKSRRWSIPITGRTVPFVDLDRYAGDWFEIARFPNRFQRQCVGDVRASYARRPDGRLDVMNRCRTADGQTEARGVARIVDEQAFARLKVRFAPAWLSFVPLVWGDYWIIALAPDYSWAVVGDPGREYLWILARTPRLDEESVAAARAAARVGGYDVARLVQTAHAGAGRP